MNSEIIPSWQGNAVTMLGPVPTPEQLRAAFPIDVTGHQTVARHRAEIQSWHRGIAAPLLVIVGPCSIDATTIEDKFAVEVFADKLFEAVEKEKIDSRLKIVLRMPPAKPRSELGWSGLEQTDLATSVQVLARLANQGRPVAMEMMNEQHFARFGDSLAMGWVGARTVEGSPLRHTISAHPELPILFKNSMHPEATSSMEVAKAAARTAAAQHVVEIMHPDGTLEKVLSKGNVHTGRIFRGNTHTTPESFKRDVAAFAISRPFVADPLVIDASHANARAHIPVGCDPKRPESMVMGQLACLESIADLIEANKKIAGVMIESHLISGRGELPGQSKTDPCLDLETTIAALHTLSMAKFESTHWHRQPGRGPTY